MRVDDTKKDIDKFKKMIGNLEQIIGSQNISIREFRNQLNMDTEGAI
jgi:wobble nucleotide-excising tRNase